MSPAILLLLSSTLALAAGATWPRQGQGVMLMLAPGVAPEWAFAVPDWRIRSIRAFGPVTFILGMPETPAADPALLRRAAGVALAILAAPPDDCTRP